MSVLSFMALKSFLMCLELKTFRRLSFTSTFFLPAQQGHRIMVIKASSIGLTTEAGASKAASNLRPNVAVSYIITFSIMQRGNSLLTVTFHVLSTVFRVATRRSRNGTRHLQ